MKVVDLINILNQIGYDENTELTFSCTDGNTGQYYEIPFEEISFGEELTGKPYEKDQIDIEVDVDSVKSYLHNKGMSMLDDLILDMRDVIAKYRE